MWSNTRRSLECHSVLWSTHINTVPFNEVKYTRHYSAIQCDQAHVSTVPFSVIKHTRHYSASVIKHTRHYSTIQSSQAHTSLQCNSALWSTQKSAIQWGQTCRGHSAFQCSQTCRGHYSASQWGQTHRDAESLCTQTAVWWWPVLLKHSWGAQ